MCHDPAALIMQPSHLCPSCFSIVGPPGGLDWSAPWHHIFHEWNARALNFLNKLVSNYGPEDAGNNIGN